MKPYWVRGVTYIAQNEPKVYEEELTILEEKLKVNHILDEKMDPLFLLIQNEPTWFALVILTGKIEDLHRLME